MDANIFKKQFPNSILVDHPSYPQGDMCGEG